MRIQFGHWEGDLMLFRRTFGQANVTSLVERVSRFTVILKTPIEQRPASWASWRK
ncbi:MAG: IS30 family transposase [Yoonia sp.]|jgi:IS30 family transposase